MHYFEQVDLEGFLHDAFKAISDFLAIPSTKKDIILETRRTGFIKLTVDWWPVFWIMALWKGQNSFFKPNEVKFLTTNKLAP